MGRGTVFAVILTISIGCCFAHLVPEWWDLGFSSCALDFDACPGCADTDLCDEDTCSNHGGKHMVRALSVGLLDSYRGCQSLFNDTRWNCTTFDGEYLFGKFVEDNFTRETALVYAFVSAGLTHAVASACQKGVVDGCPCQPQSPERVDGETYIYQCNDNLEFAALVVKKFFDCCHFPFPCPWPFPCPCFVKVVEWCVMLGMQTLNETGTSRYCRCTGLSGSCSIRTCYDKAAPLEDTHRKLRAKYEGSQKVVLVDNSTLRLAGNTNLDPLPDFPVHTSDSPDLCTADAENGVLGTVGRECDPSDSCNHLCCGRGFELVRYNVTRQKCRFEWCCRVKCTDLPPVQTTKYLCL